MRYQSSNPRQRLIFLNILVFALAFLLPIPQVNASNIAGPYFSLTGSMDSFGDSSFSNIAPTLSEVNIGAGFSDTALGFSHSIGYKFKNSFSAELEFSYKNRDFRGDVGGDMTSKTFLANGIYSFDIREFYTPYVGYGIGYTFHEANINTRGDRTDLTLAYQLKVGVDIEFSRKVSMLLGYKYLTTDNTNLKDYFSAESFSHAIEAGVKFHY